MNNVLNAAHNAPGANRHDQQPVHGNHERLVLGVAVIIMRVGRFLNLTDNEDGQHRNDHINDAVQSIHEQVKESQIMAMKMPTTA